MGWSFKKKWKLKKRLPGVRNSEDSRLPCVQDTKNPWLPGVWDTGDYRIPGVPTEGKLARSLKNSQQNESPASGRLGMCNSQVARMPGSLLKLEYLHEKSLKLKMALGHL